MNKRIVNGKVGVLVSHGYGAGWYSWHSIEQLLFDPVVIDMVERKADAAVIEAYCKHTYDDIHGLNYYGGADGLVVHWVPVGAKFRIHEYDGAETLILESEEKWIVA